MKGLLGPKFPTPCVLEKSEKGAPNCIPNPAFLPSPEPLPSLRALLSLSG